MKVSLISGILKERDAVSSSTKAKALALQEIFRSLKEDLEMQVFVYAADYAIGDCVRIAPHLNGILLDEHFLASDLVIYDFGIYNDLFNSIYLTPASSTKIVHFHNITPLEYSQEYNQEYIHASLVQRSNLFLADVILSTSRFSTRDLIDYGVDAERIHELPPMPVSLESAPGPDQSLAGCKEASGTIEAMYVGRFVSSKGLHDLLTALRKALDSGAGNIHLNLVGSLELSDPSYFKEVLDAITNLGLEDNVDVLEGASDEERDACYSRCDLFLTASYHEGFCVPVIEALSHGCYVIAYDAGNLRNVVNGLGNTVATGDVGALADRIADYVRMKNAGAKLGEAVLRPDTGEMSEAALFAKTHEYLLGFSPKAFRDRLKEILSQTGCLPLVNS